MGKENVVVHKRFHAAFNKELKAHGITSKAFMLSCGMGHDIYSSVKKVRM